LFHAEWKFQDYFALISHQILLNACFLKTQRATLVWIQYNLRIPMFKTDRKPEFPVDPLILNRWSQRALSSEPLSHEELMSLFEAARWAQNSYNNQPWRFIYARRNTPAWTTLLGLLAPSNALWAQNGSVLMVIISKKTFDYDGRPSITHTFDTGAAAQNMALQGASMDIVVHGMEGFDYERARTELQVPDEFRVEAMFAVGKVGSKEALPQKYQEREVPSERRPFSEFVFEGTFPKSS
jgi:nitroreductase